MEKLRGSIGGAVSSVLVAGALLTGCGQKGAQDATSTRATDKTSAASSNKNVQKSLEAIREKFEGKSHLLVLEKAYWLDKKIWVSLGIERASVTGLVGSVMGYIPAHVRKVGGLLVLERDNAGRFAGTALTPDVALNAYPIVEETETAVVVDVANPRTEYGLTNLGFYAGANANTELKPRLEYVKDVSISAEGIAFKSVVNAISPVALYQPGQGSPEEAAGLDPFSVSLTLRTDWRIPAPTADYVALDARMQPVGFFQSAPIVENGGLSTKKFVARISTTRKHVWEMSANTPTEYQNAVRDGVLAWNEVLGNDVLQVRVAPQDKDITDPNTSNVIWDDNKAVGFAFANWRDNPQTGEIIQGQVYMSGAMWAEQGGLVYDLRNLEKLLREALEAAREAERAEQQERKRVEEEQKAKEEFVGPPAPPAQQDEFVGPPAQNERLINKVRQLQRKIASSVTKLQKDLKSPNLIRRGFVTLNPSQHDEIAHHKGFCQREVRVDELRDLVSAVTLVDGNILTSAIATKSEVLNSQQKTADGIARVLKHQPYPAETVTREAFQYNVVRSVVMHEVGHALGLRHNFMGSLETSDNGRIESASIMDYNDLVVDAQFDRIGDSDRAVMEMGYKRIPPSKDFKICTDEHAMLGIPGCLRHDYSADPVDFLMTSQESSLLMAFYFGQRGDSNRMVRNINRALMTNQELAAYLNFSLDEGQQIDPNFGAQQVKALAATIASRKMYDLPFPEELVAVYGGLSRLVLGISVTEGAAQNPTKAPIIADLAESVLDEKSLFGKDIRLAGVNGLLKIQDANARHTLKTLHGSLGVQSLKADAERNLESRMMDEYVQNAVKAALDSYYAVGSQGNQ